MQFGDEAILEPELPIIDPHHHLGAQYLLDDLLRDTGSGHNIVATLGKLGLTFDAWIYHPQIDELAQLARACPNTRIVLNHIGTPLGIGAYTGKRQEVFAKWAASIKALAAHPNVFIKVGGFGMSSFNLGFIESATRPSSEVVAVTARPYVETCIETFGTSRCMFESNFPNDKPAFSYAVFWNACKRLAKGASDSEKTDLFTRTAARFYRLDVDA